MMALVAVASGVALDGLMGGGLITLEKAHVVLYRSEP